jgi:hypothetical protein
VIVVGILAPSGSGANVAGGAGSSRAVAIARRAAGTGARTEIVGVAPVGGAGDRLLASLASAGVGHATVIRSDASGIEAADLELALRYLPEVRVVVLVAPPAGLVETALAATSWSGAPLILVGPLDSEAAALALAAEPSPVVLAPPAHDPDDAFAGVVASLATRLDAGEDAAGAWHATLASLAIEPS